LRPQVLALRRLHPGWGAGRIRVELHRLDAPAPLPSLPTLRRWLARAGLAPPRDRRPATRQPRATQPHQVWQMDAAEQIRLRQGPGACWLRLVDEASGAFLLTRVFAGASWPEVGAPAVQQALRQAFALWGRPEGPRVDHGVPWVGRGGLPTDLELWLAGLGVRLHVNPRRRPQANSQVERAQRTGQDWAGPSLCDTVEQLQRRVDEEDRVQRQHYPLAEGVSRLEAYPGLRHSGRGYGPWPWEFVCWDLSAALGCLGQWEGERKVDASGCVSLYDRRHHVGRAYAGRRVRVRFCAAGVEWVFVAGPEEVGRSAAVQITAERIGQLRVSGRPGRSAGRTQARRAQRAERGAEPGPGARGEKAPGVGAAVGVSGGQPGRSNSGSEGTTGQTL
jgi:hypothetical protein